MLVAPEDLSSPGSPTPSTHLFILSPPGSPSSQHTSSSLTHCMESWLQCTHKALRRMVSRSNSCSWKACGGGKRVVGPGQAAPPQLSQVTSTDHAATDKSNQDSLVGPHPCF